MDEQKVQLEIKKRGAGVEMLVIVLARTRNYGKSVKRDTEVRKSI